MCICMSVHMWLYWYTYLYVYIHVWICVNILIYIYLQVDQKVGFLGFSENFNTGFKVIDTKLLMWFYPCWSAPITKDHEFSNSFAHSLSGKKLCNNILLRLIQGNGYANELQYHDFFYGDTLENAYHVWISNLGILY